MVEDDEVAQEEPSNACCAALKKKHAKLLEKYKKLEVLKNKFRKCTTTVQEKYDVLEKENESLKKVLAELKVKANALREEKENKTGIHIDLENEVSTLKGEDQKLKHNGNSASQEADKHLHERLNAAEIEIKQLLELVDKEKERTALEKKKGDLEKKNGNEAMKQLEMGNKKISEAQNLVNVERKKAEEYRLSLEKLNKKIDAMVNSKSEAAEKKVEADNKQLLERLNEADKKIKQLSDLVDKERERTDLEKRKADLEKKNANEASKQVEMGKKKFSEAQNLANVERKKAEEYRLSLDKLNKKIDAMVKSKSEAAEKKLEAEKQKAIRERERADLAVAKTEEQLEIASREQKRADSEKKKAKKHKEVAEAHKKMAIEQKQRADQLSRELDSYRLRLEEKQKELQELVSYRTYVDNEPLRNCNIVSEADTVKLLKKQLKLEKMLVKQAKKVSNVEAVRNNMLHQELFRLKQECLQFQQRLNILDKSFIRGGEGTHQLEKIGNQTSVTLCSDGYQSQLISGIDSRLDPPYRGSNEKMLQSSAIYSSSASFSNRPLVGSQERGTLPVTTSAKLGKDVSNSKSTISKLSDKAQINYNVHAVAKTDKPVKSTIKDNSNGKRVGTRERKSILDAVESIEKMYSKGKKLHQRTSEKISLLHDMLNDQKDESKEDNLKEDSCRGLVRPCKRRKTSCDGKIVVHHLQGSGLNALKLDGHSKDGKNNMLDVNQCIPHNFDEMAAYDCMKLLDLDNADEENSYRRAIAMPLSPMLPDVEFHGNEKVLAARRDLLSASSVQAIDTDRTDLVVNNIVSSSLHRKEDSVGFIKDTDSNIPCEKRIAASPRAPLKYFVVSSDNRDNHSILRIVHTISNCLPQLSVLHSADIFIRSILHALLKCEDLSMKEKVCVLFSLTLHGISEVGSLTNVSSDVSGQSVDSATLHIHSALSEPDLRRMFMQSFHLFELLAVVEDFLLHRKVFVQADASTGPNAIPSTKINLDINGNNIMLSEMLAPAHLLVAGGTLLASLCSAFDHIGFLCEMSCNIITMQFNPAVMLEILHAFARVCGAKYFYLQQYSVAMTAVKSLVVLLEKQSDSTLFSPSIAANLSEICPCSTSCPFSDGAVCMEDVALLLLENLQKHGQSKSCPQEELVNLIVPRVQHHEDRIEGSLGLRDESLCTFIDTLSLVELLASFMSWNWTFDHIIDQICEYLELHLMEGFAAAAIILLGQLGRVGVRASGYDDTRVKKLRGRLSAFVCPTTFSKLVLPVQFAIINALFGLTPTKFEGILEDKVESQSFPTNFIREWFLLLSNEQQSSFRLHLQDR